ncbi:uncharacterized protein LOC113987311 isoform X2 [Pipra filicauda]|uniref:Uncharacterized protein LOC113987311 isoform X2 n=1 Tax=Pipra filicauda TaxID=649802 RepID=A0A7R5KFT5_9PASS|nr:uncharacterized protein LOC113987311 isoform X2 [Pipra filicauda]
MRGMSHSPSPYGRPREPGCAQRHREARFPDRERDGHAANILPPRQPVYLRPQCPSLNGCPCVPPARDGQPGRGGSRSPAARRSRARTSRRLPGGRKDDRKDRFVGTVRRAPACVSPGKGLSREINREKITGLISLHLASFFPSCA